MFLIEFYVVSILWGLHFETPLLVGFLEVGPHMIGKYVSYNHLRVFECKAFVHIPKDERSKLNVKT